MSAITWTQTPVLYKTTLPSGNSYWLSDDEVRQWIGDGTTSGAEKRLSDAESAITALSNATHWVGITTTELTDGATTNPITINGNSYTAKSGDITQYSTTEFIFNGTAWQQFGASLGTLKNFAYVDTGTVTITPAGSVSAPTISVSSAGATAKVTGITNVGSMPTYTVENGVLTITAGATPTADTEKTFKTGDASYSASAPTFTGTEASHTVYPAT